MNGVVVEYYQYTMNKDSLYATNPYFAVETRLRGCDSFVFRLPISESEEDANVGGIAGFAIRPIVTDYLPTPKPFTLPPKATSSPMEQEASSE